MSIVGSAALNSEGYIRMRERSRANEATVCSEIIGSHYSGR
jgi:hypothetical protein